jgi:uncharacterized protein
MRNGRLIIDVDAHYLEPIQEITQYLDEPWRTRLGGVSPDRLIPQTLGDRMMQGRLQRPEVDYGYGIGVSDGSELGPIMERLGVDATLLIGNRITGFGHMSVRDWVVALSNGYIDYMLDKVADPTRGLYTAPVVPWQDPQAGAEIVDRVGDHPAVVGVCFMCSGANPPLGDVRYDPIYAAADRHNLPMIFHSSPGLTLTEGATYVDGLSRLVEAHSLGFAISNMIQLTSLLMQGIPERFPRLRFLFQESGLFWIPMMQFRLDEYYLKRREEAPLLRALPSEYIRERFFFGTQPIEAPKNPRFLESVFDAANGRSQFMFSSDYPHFDFDDPIIIDRMPFLSEDDKRAVLAGNALRFFDFEKGGKPPWLITSSEMSTTSRKEPAKSSS